MNKRIKKLRKSLDLTQQEFGDRIGIKRNTLANYEIGRNEPIDAVITLICRPFNVSEEWLRTGEGEMFVQTGETAVDRLCAELHASDLEARIIRAYFRIDPRIREPFMQRLIQEIQTEYSPAADQEQTGSDTAVQERPRAEKPVKDWTDSDIEAEVSEYRQQLLDEKEQAAKQSVSSGSSSGAKLA